MAQFTEARIQKMIAELKDDFGSEIATRELAVLELEDMKRKGCILEDANKFDECRSCSKATECPVLTWEKRHPEYKDDELAMRIKVLEAGGEEAYKKKLEAQEEAKKKAEEATDEDRVIHARSIVNDYWKGKMTNVEALRHIDEVLNAKTEIKSIMGKATQS